MFFFCRLLGVLDVKPDIIGWNLAPDIGKYCQDLLISSLQSTRLCNR